MTDYMLCQLSPEDGIEIYEMLQRIDSQENGFNNEAKGLSFSEYKKWLVERDSWSRGENLPDGYVKQWMYWLKVNGIPVGVGKIREKTTESSKKWGGNIGFAIDSLYRGKGYGTVLFNQLLIQAKKKNIKEIYSTVKTYNASSNAVHIKCGGTIVNQEGDTCYYVFHLQ